MKFKQQEDTSQINPFLKSTIDLIVLSKQFLYAIDCYNTTDSLQLSCIKRSIEFNYKDLIKLAIALDSAHKHPTMTVDYVPAEDVKDLKILEEKYYNMLKEIANNALEQNNAEVFSYLSPMIKEFNHYFCTLDEDNDSGKTSS
jgi:hypothetical protein